MSQSYANLSDYSGVFRVYAGTWFWAWPMHPLPPGTEDECINARFVTTSGTTGTNYVYGSASTTTTMTCIMPAHWKYGDDKGQQLSFKLFIAENNPSVNPYGNSWQVLSWQSLDT